MPHRFLAELDRLLTTRGDAVSAWFEDAFAKAPAPLTASVDLRHSGQRLVPVDTNIYPAGWNNVSAPARARATTRLRRLFAVRFAGVRRVLLLPENHTRNQGYLQNLAALRDLIAAAGPEVVLGRLADDLAEPMTVVADGVAEPLVYHPLARDGATLRTKDGFAPDAVVLNNDLSDGLPPILRGVAQPVMPPAELGWYRRHKSVHFAAYDATVAEFAEAFGIDPWRLNAIWRHCGAINFRAREGLDCVARAVDEVVSEARKKHRAYGLAYDPYLFVKADAGTYGMGVMTVRSGEEAHDLNKKRRHSMDKIKGGVANTQVLVQEGVPTADLVDGASAEPVIYLVNGEPVGGFYRVHKAKDEYDSLNAVGSGFAAICEEVEDTDLEPSGDFTDTTPCHFRVFGTVARLAALAAAREMTGLDEPAPAEVAAQ